MNILPTESPPRNVRWTDNLINGVQVRIYHPPVSGHSHALIWLSGGNSLQPTKPELADVILGSWLKQELDSDCSYCSQLCEGECTTVQESK